MNIVFRVDGSAALGAGHLVRCRNLADLLAQHGANCYFLIGQHNDVTQRVLAHSRHTILSLDLTEHDALDVDAFRSVENLRQIGVGVLDWVVVDHYHLDASWESVVRNAVPELFVATGPDIS